MNVDLTPFFEKVKNIRAKNRGGCLFFALLFWKWLKQQGHDTSSFEIVQYNYDKQEIEHNLKWIESLTGNACSSNHFTWLYDGVEYDAESPRGYIRGAFLSERGVLHGLNMPGHTPLVDAFCEDALMNSEWNDEFDRSSAIRRIENLFDIDMTHVDNY